MVNRSLFLAVMACCCLAVKVSSSVPPQAQGETAQVQYQALRKLSDQLAKFKGKLEEDKTDPARLFYRIKFDGYKLKPVYLAELRPILLDVKDSIELFLDNNCTTDADLAQLKDLTCIRRLGLYADKVTNAGLEHLWGLENLEVLHIASDNITNAGLTHVAKLTKLRDLSVSSKSVTAAAHNHLTGLKDLEKLSVGTIISLVGDAELAQMKAMKKLRVLRIGGRNLTDTGMGQLGDFFPELRELYISGRGNKLTKAGLDRLAGLKNLERLTMISCAAVEGDGLAVVPALTNLRRLDISAPKVADRNGPGTQISMSHVDQQTVRYIGQIRTLEHLRLHEADDRLLMGISGMAGLKELDLSGTQVGNLGMRHLSGLKFLRTLNLSNTSVTDNGVLLLGGLTQLESLDLGQPGKSGVAVKFLGKKEGGLTDDGLKHLSGMTDLKTLNLAGSKITGPGLKHLTFLPDMKSARSLKAGDQVTIYGQCRSLGTSVSLFPCLPIKKEP
jgi:Leucine-rich repeat (LRR) protein